MGIYFTSHNDGGAEVLTEADILYPRKFVVPLPRIPTCAESFHGIFPQLSRQAIFPTLSCNILFENYPCAPHTVIISTPSLRNSALRPFCHHGIRDPYMDSLDYDVGWRSIIQEMDKGVSKRVYNEASAILPFSFLEEDLQNVQCTPQGFQAAIRSQIVHLLLKKGPRQSSSKEELPKNTMSEEEVVDHTESIAPIGPDGKTVKMRYKAKRLAEQKVVASLFHFLWPSEVYGFNPITIKIRPLSSNMRRKCKTKPLSSRFASYRLKWQFKMVAEKVVSHARDMKQMCSRIPTYMKQLPVLFFNLARMFVAAHCEAYLEVQGGVQNYKAINAINRTKTIELLSKTSRSFENFRRSMRHMHKKAGIAHNDCYLEGAFGAMLKSAEAILADLTIIASPHLVYDDKLYLEALNYLRCSEGNASCRQYPEVCFLDRTTEKELVSDQECSGVDIAKILQLPLQGSNRNSLEALGFVANFMRSCSKVYEKRLRELNLSEMTIAALRMQYRRVPLLHMGSLWFMVCNTLRIRLKIITRTASVLSKLNAKHWRFGGAYSTLCKSLLDPLRGLQPNMTSNAQASMWRR